MGSLLIHVKWDEFDETQIGYHDIIELVDDPEMWMNILDSLLILLCDRYEIEGGNWIDSCVIQNPSSKIYPANARLH